MHIYLIFEFSDHIIYNLVINLNVLSIIKKLHLGPSVHLARYAIWYISCDFIYFHCNTMITNNVINHYLS